LPFRWDDQEQPKRVRRVPDISGEDPVACLANPFRGTALLEAIDAAITAAKHKVEQDSAAAGRFA
jgi:hypothetical protein